MLQKAPQITVDHDNIFINDKMKRESTVQLFTNLISTLKQPYTICLDAPWGGGKSTFINMWSKYLENNNYVTLHFNAWENDFTSEPFISLISEINNQLVLKTDKEPEVIKDYKEKLVKSGAMIIKKSIPLAVKLLTLNTLEAEDLKDMVDASETKAISDFLSKTAEEQINSYEDNKNIRDNFKTLLSDFAKQVIELEEKNSPIVLFIDELDRCKPSYTIELLEHIKHIFNLEKFVFILAVDKEQLKHSIKSYYGQGLDAESYLKKFFDIDLRLPTNADKSYITHLA